MARVLLVEDEIPVLLFAEFVLEGLGHSTVSVSSRTEALALLEADDVDVLFTDIRLPESDLAGFELAQQAREIGRLDRGHCRGAGLVCDPRPQSRAC